MNILLTGGTGYVGKNLLKSLLKENHNVELFSRSIHSNLKTKIIDFDDLTSVDNLRIDKSIDVVFHLSGCAHANEKRNYDRYRLNTLSTIMFAKRCLESNVGKFIFVSSIKANHVIDSNQKGLKSKYAIEKRKAELGILDVAKNSNMQVIIVRPALIYGPNIKGNLKLMLSGVKNGWLPPLPEMNDCHSMVHIDDVILVLLKLMKCTKNIGGEFFCITDGIKYSAHDIYNTLRSVYGKPIPKWVTPRFVFKFISLFNSLIKNKLDKLFQNDCHDNFGMDIINFHPTKELKDINETNI